MADNIENECKLKVKWLELREYKCFFWYVLISSIVIVFFLAIIVWKIILIENYNFSLHFQDTIPIILTVLGVFIAFTAINIYSIFNSRVDEEKKALEKLKNEYESQIKDLTNNYGKIGMRIDNIKKGMQSALDELVLENLLNNLIDVNFPIIDRVTAAWKLIRLIEHKKKSINTTNLKDESINLEGELTTLKLKIKSRIKYKKFKQITYLQSVIKRLKDLLDEEDTNS